MLLAPLALLLSVLAVPIVLLYQGWTYYVFRHRVGGDDLAPLRNPIDLLAHPKGEPATGD